MLGSNRLTVRLIFWLALVQVATVMLGMAVWMLFSPYVTFRDVAADNARRIIAEAVVASPDGRSVTSTIALNHYRAARPGFGFAVSRDGAILKGSTPMVASYVESLGKAVPQNGKLLAQIDGGNEEIVFEAVETRVGRLLIATTGDAFRAEDFRSLIAVYLRSVLTIYLPAIIAALIIVPVIVALTLRPLRHAARAAELIDIDSLDMRLPVQGMPREIVPFIAVMNRLLGRLSEGVSAQRLFTANAAHELRTPTAILAARIESLPPSPSKVSLERDCRRIAILTNQLLAATRMSALEEGVTERIDLVAIARDVVADIAPLAIRTGRTIELLPEVSQAPVRGNADALASALRNLCDNALRAEPDGGTVAVTVGATKAAAWVEVRDNGPGIASSDAARIFEPFWRKGAAEEGSGLGLSIVRQVIEAHDGRVEVAPAGRGATLRIELPTA